MLRRVALSLPLLPRMSRMSRQPAASARVLSHPARDGAGGCSFRLTFVQINIESVEAEPPQTPPTRCAAWLETASGTPIDLASGCSIGRATENQVVIPSTQASRKHAQIYARHGDEFWLSDLGSVNGTWLNSRRIARSTRLRDGDTISVAGISFTFHHPAAANLPPTSIAQSTIREVRQERCWLLVTDIENSTPLSRELSPAEVALRIQRFLSACADVIENFNGHINRYAGDSLVAFWVETDAALPQVVGAMRELQQLRPSVEPKFRAVLHRGMVAFAGSTSTGEENLLGEDVHFVFRLEKIAAQYREPFVVSHHAAELLGEFFELESLGTRRVKGFSGYREFFRLAESR